MSDPSKFGFVDGFILGYVLCLLSVLTGWINNGK